MDYSMTIGGDAVRTDDSFAVENPATARPFALAPHCDAGLVDAVMLAAAGALTSWQADEDSRRNAVASCAKVIADAEDELATVLTTEQGKPVAEARAEVRAAAAWFAYYSAMNIPDEVLQDDEVARVELRRRPLGVVVAITPWNYPLLLAAFKIAPALLAGNTVVLKPSPYTPLSSLLLGQLLAKVLPPGVFNVVSGRDSLGPMLTEHPVPRMISFTGSTATGRLVAASASQALKHMTLELGGNDAAILLDDIDPAQVVDQVFWSAFANNGQTCIAIKRLFVPESIYAVIVDMLAERARTVVVGDGAADGTQLGPLNNRRQLEIVVDMLEAARASGARVVAGGDAIDGPGHFHQPTIVADIDDQAGLVAREQFGPALPVLPYRTIDEAVQRANSTDFGLGGSVWSGDADRAAHVAGRLECGTAWVNTHMVLWPNVPFGAFKSSGLGVENGLLGYQSFTELQTHHVAKA